MAVSRQKLTTLWVSPGHSRELSGSAHLLVLSVLTALFVSGGCYLYSVNQSAVQGYHMRTLEKEIGVLKQENAELRIAEADLRSLQRIETAEGEFQMQKLENVKYLEEHDAPSPLVSGQGGPVALR